MNGRRCPDVRHHLASISRQSLFHRFLSRGYHSHVYPGAEKIVGVANYLAAKGVKHGDRVAVCGKNSPEWAIAYLAILYVGATVIPLDYQLKDEEIDFLLTFAGVQYLFIDAERINDIDSKGTVGLLEKISLEVGHSDYIFKKWQKRRPNAKARPRMTSLRFLLPLERLAIQKESCSHPCQPSLRLFPCPGPDDAVSHRHLLALLPIHHSYTMLAVFYEAISVGAEIVFGKKLIVSQIP